MTSSQQRKNRDWVASALPPLREFSPEARQFSDAQPSLHLLVYCNLHGVVVTARVLRLDDKGRLLTTTVAEARFRPSEVSERLVVEWGQRALSSWLAQNMTNPESPR